MTFLIFRRSFLRVSLTAAIAVGIAFPFSIQAETGTPSDILSFAGGVGNQRFYAVHELSDGTVLIGGAADDLNWLSSVPQTTLAVQSGELINTNPSGSVAFLLHASSDLSQILRVAYFPSGLAEEIRYIKTDVPLGSPTGNIYISGKNSASGRDDGYYVAKLNGNFVSAPPTAVEWAFTVWATGDHKEFQPWDVDANGRVVYGRGEPNTTNWSEIKVWDPALLRDAPVTGFRQHFLGTDPDSVTDWQGLFADAPQPVLHSSLVLKPRGRGSLRSWNSTDFDGWFPDGNGGVRKGKWPCDMFYNSAFDVSNTSANQTMPGYTGYRFPDSGSTTGRLGAVVVDKRNGHFYIGFNFKSILPGGNPDFEPTVMAFDENGNLKWWNRLWREYTGAAGTGTPNTSSPDQYVDGLAIDYSLPVSSSRLAVLARSHGNNTVNFWSGNQIVDPSNPGYSFHNSFTGTSGNIHISWVGFFGTDTGNVLNATWNAEYVDGSTNYGSAYSDANLEGWPSHNSGWPNLNTTRLRPTVHFDLSGRLYILAKSGRRTITTANAFQQMPKFSEGSSCWNHYVRVFSPDLTTLVYSSVMTGDWDKGTGAGGDNVEIHGIYPTANGILAVGFHEADGSGNPTGNAAPTRNTLTWGTSTRTGETPVVGKLMFSAGAMTGANEWQILE
ncbi:MAG: hypothetical protein ACFCU1_00735 [Sumerlaeia bacterium]